MTKNKQARAEQDAMTLYREWLETPEGRSVLLTTHLRKSGWTEGEISLFLAQIPDTPPTKQRPTPSHTPTV